MRARQGLCVNGCGGDDYALDLEKRSNAFSCILRKMWYIAYDEGVICANWVANPYLKR